MLLRGRNRSRSRSRSPALRIPGLIKRLKKNRYGKRDPEPKEYRLIYSALGLDDFKLFLLDIPSESLTPFRNATYNPDTHVSQKLSTIPKYLATTDWFVYSKPVVVGSTMYALAQKKVGFDGLMKMDVLTLDLNSRVKQWKRLPSLPRFEINTTLHSLLISLRGLLFVLGAYPSFGAFFNPKTRKWSKLKDCTSNGVCLKSNNVLFIASLGESLGKFLVLWVDGTKTINLFDVPSNCWDPSAIPGDLFYSRRVGFHPILDRPVMVEENGCHTLYFMDNAGMVYAFDSDTMKLSQGKVSGFVEDGFKSILEYRHHSTFFLHFGGELFCLCCPTYQLTGDRHYVDNVFYDDDDNMAFTVGCHSCFHFIFIRVIKVDDHSLEAYFVGCLEDTVEGKYSPFGAFFI